MKRKKLVCPSALCPAWTFDISSVTIIQAMVKPAFDVVNLVKTVSLEQVRTLVKSLEQEGVRDTEVALTEVRQLESHARVLDVCFKI